MSQEIRYCEQDVQDARRQDQEPTFIRESLWCTNILEQHENCGREGSFGGRSSVSGTVQVQQRDIGDTSKDKSTETEKALCRVARN